MDCAFFRCINLLVMMVVLAGLALMPRADPDPDPVALDENWPTIYCGDELRKKLFKVCHGRYNKRSVDDTSIDDDDVDDEASYSPHFLRKREALEMVTNAPRRRKGGITYECCEKGCTRAELQTYCEVPEPTPAPAPASTTPAEPAPE